MYNIGVKKIHRLIKYRNRREDAAELVQLECREKCRHLCVAEYGLSNTTACKQQRGEMHG